MAKGGAGGGGGGGLEFTLREFQGVNVQSPREAIGENEFGWLENIIPIAAGNLIPTQGPSAALATIAGETGAPTYTMTFNVNGVDYTFAVWSGSGDGWLVNMTTFATTKIFTGTLVSGQTQAAQWSNLGLLIIDPAGYWDWNVTTPGVVTSLGYALLSVTANPITGSITATYSWRTLVTPTGAGSGGMVTANTYVSIALLTTAGTGYVVGDILSYAPGTLPVATLPTFTVTAIGGGGAISGISISNSGSIQIPAAGGTFTAGGGVPTNMTGGSGTGAQFTLFYSVANYTIANGGSGYTTGAGGDIQYFTGGIWHGISPATMTLTVSGATTGTAIAVYAGRVWTANNRTISFTDAGSYNSYISSGSAFTITDSYLHAGVTALYPANNYLYIFGDDSIDALSNVTVSAGIASFSRININSSIGTRIPTSIFPYFRGLVFANTSGFYVLSGATPEKLSDKLAGLISQITFADLVYGGTVIVQNEMCAAFLFTFTDIFTVTVPTSRTLLALFFRGRWWMASMGALNLLAMVSIPTNGIQTIYAWAANSLYQCFTGATANWIIKTRLWDAGAPLKEKQAINAAIGLNLVAASAPGVSFYSDTEYLSTLDTIGVAKGAVAAGYNLLQGAVQAGGSQYLGITLTGGANVSKVRLLALRGASDRDMLL